MTDRFEDRLSEYVDGTLSPTDARRVEAHLAACEACARTLDELRAVAERAAALAPRTPPRDLWPEIAAAIERTAREEPTPPAAVPGSSGPVPSTVPGSFGEDEPPATPLAPASRRRIALSVPQLAAAAVLLVSLSAGAAWLAARGAGGGARPMAGPAGDAPGAGAAFVAADASADGAADAAERYAAAIRDLEAALFETGAPLPPETEAAVRRSLHTIDRAIADARRALDAAPADPYVRRHLAATMRRKIDFLRGTVRLVTQS